MLWGVVWQSGGPDRVHTGLTLILPRREISLHINKRLQLKINFWANSLKILLHLKWFPFFLNSPPLSPGAPLSLLPPSFLPLLLSPSGNYQHKSFFALWFAPFHKWRLSLFNRGGFASHVKAYNVAGPCFLHTPPPLAPLPLSTHLHPWLHSPSPRTSWKVGRGGGAPRLRLARAQGRGGLQWIMHQTELTWLEGDEEVVKNHLW